MKPDEAGGASARGGAWLFGAFAVGLYVAARLWRLDASCLWFDEIFGVHAARQDFAAMLRFVALDLIHPPLFYLLLKAWIAATGDSSIWWLRLLPVAASVLALVPLTLLARELRLAPRTLSLALLLAATSGTLIKYSQELRMYGPLLLFAACSLWLFARFLNSETNNVRAALPLFAANLLLVYTHYFGWLVVLLQLVYLALFQRRKLWAHAATVALVAACFAPWAWVVLRAAREAGGGLEQNLGWAARPRLYELFSPFLVLHEPFRARQQSNEPLVLGANVRLAIAIFGPAFVVLFRRTFLRVAGAESNDGARRVEIPDTRAALNGDDPRPAIIFLLFFSVAPVVAAFVLALALPQSVWGTRHLIIIAPAYLLLAALALDTLRPAWLALAAKILLGVWLLITATFTLARRAPPPVWCAWETLAQTVTREASSTPGVTSANGATKIYAFEDLVAYQLWHALRPTGARNLRVAVVRNLPGVYEDRAFFLPRGFDEVATEEADAAMREDEFWIAFRDADWREEHPILKTLRARGYDFERRFEVEASGQRAFVVLARRRR